MVKIVGILIVITLLTVGTGFAKLESSSYTEKAAEMSGRAINNIFLSPCEVGIQTVQHPLGLFKGLGMWIGRTFLGIADSATFWVPKYKNPSFNRETIMD